MKYVRPNEFSSYASNLYQTEDGTWRLRFWKGDFKNDGSKDEDYDAPLPKALGTRIEEYLDVYRPVLIRRNPEAPWVFPNLHGNMHKDVGQLMASVAQNYIPEVSRLRPHALPEQEPRALHGGSGPSARQAGNGAEALCPP
jgi:hypothetical protein